MVRQLLPTHLLPLDGALHADEHTALCVCLVLRLRLGIPHLDDRELRNQAVLGGGVPVLRMIIVDAQTQTRCVYDIHHVIQWLEKSREEVGWGVPISSLH